MSSRELRISVTRSSPVLFSKWREKHGDDDDEDQEEKEVFSGSFSSESPARDFPMDDPVVLLHERGAVDLSRINALGSVLLNHDPSRVVGVPENVTIADDGDARTGSFSIRFGTDEESQAARQKVKEGLLRGVSVRYNAEHAVRIEEGESWKSPGGRTFEGPLIVADRWSPVEISLTPVPADASVGIGRSQNTIENFPLMKENTMAKEEKALESIRSQLEAMGLKKDASYSEMLEFIANLGKRESPKGDTAPIVDPVAEERARISGLRKVAELSGDHSKLGDWIDNGTTVRAARDEVFDAILAENAPITRARGDIEVGKDSREKFNTEHERAILIRCSRSHNSLSRIARDLEPGDVPIDIPIAEAYRRFLIRDGVAGARAMTRNQLAEHFASQRAMNHSTSDFTNILANVMNKSLAQGFDEAPVTYSQWTTSGSLPDFKQATRAKLSEAKQFAETPELMPIAETTIADAKEVYQLKTYANKLSISRQSIVNDDLSAFSRIPQMFGSAAARTTDQLVYDKLNTPPTMLEGALALFSDSHASGDNLASGALTIANLSTARGMMRKQTGINGEKIDVIPVHLIVPVDLESTAFNVVNGTFVPTSETNARPAWVGTMNVIATPRLTSATAWFLAASSSTIDTIIVAGLNSASPSPTLTRVEGQDILGVSFIAYFDVAVAALEHRGLLKSTGV